MTIARMTRILRILALVCDRCSVRVEVPGLTTSIEDMKLGVRFATKCWTLVQQIYWQALVPISTDCLFRHGPRRLFIRVI